MSSTNNLLPINLDFNGYYWADASEIPEDTGIYCVYSTKENPDRGSDGDRCVDELIYIGQAGNGDSSTLRSRIRNHAVTDYKEIDRKKYAYSFTILPAKHLDLVEAALVFQFNPKNNKNLTKKYEGPDVEVSIKGNCAGLQDFRLYNGTERF